MIHTVRGGACLTLDKGHSLVTPVLPSKSTTHMKTDSNLSMIFSQIVKTYEKEVDNLPRVHRDLGGGAARNSSGLVYENLIKRTCESLSLEPRKNDYKRTEEIAGTYLNRLQVDWHVYSQGTMKKAIESKTYLDTTRLKKSMMDFIELTNSPEVPNDVEYAIVAGQNTCSEGALLYYPSLFESLTGKEMKIFFLNPNCKRSGERPIYDKRYRQDFTLDMKTYTAFVEFLSN